MSMAQYNQTRNDLAPYFSTGQGYNVELQQDMGNLIAPFNPTMAQLQSTPGYQFSLQQGLQAA